MENNNNNTNISEILTIVPPHLSKDMVSIEGRITAKSPTNICDFRTIGGTKVYRSSYEWVCFYYDLIHYPLLNDGNMISLWNGEREIKLIIMYTKESYQINSIERIENQLNNHYFGYVIDEQPNNYPYKKGEIIMFRLKYLFQTYF